MSDLIDRQAAIDALEQAKEQYFDRRVIIGKMQDVVSNLPSAQSDIIQCRNCKFASGDSRICMKFGHSPIGELDFCSWAERRTDESNMRDK